MPDENDIRQSRLHPLRHLRHEHDIQRELCRTLERIADALPDDVDHAAARSSARLLEIGFRAHVHFEDQHLYPMVRERACRDARLLGVLDQLQAEHERDESFALEIVDELTQLAQTGRTSNPNMLGYMLRGFFEGQRRQLEWEDTLVLPMAEVVLHRADIDALADWLDRNGTAFEALTLTPASGAGLCGRASSRASGVGAP
jgi:hemerythrin-like domain-containing protein